MKLLIKLPTKQRLRAFNKCFHSIVKHAQGEHTLHVAVTIDRDDKIMNCLDVARKVNNADISATIYKGSWGGKVAAINGAMDTITDWDAAIILHDDMMLEENFDAIVASQMQSGTNQLVTFRDNDIFDYGYVLVVGRLFYESNGYLVSHDYIANAYDDDVIEQAKATDRLTICDTILVKHTHYDDPVSIASWVYADKDYELLNKRYPPIPPSDLKPCGCHRSKG